MSMQSLSRSNVFLPSIRNTRTRSMNLWSMDDVRRLRDMAGCGVPLHEIAATLRRSESAIRNKAAIHGISIRSREPEVRLLPNSRGGR
jgi:hypothetical protein